MAIRPDIAALIQGAAERYGVSPSYMLRTAQIESGGNPSAQNPRSSAGGLFQFIDSTAQQYGLRDKYDPAANADAAARLARDNAALLSRTLGRDPTDAELYLAHQQGSGGAAKILGQPDATMAQLGLSRAASLNGGSPGMTAADFAGLWTSKYGGAGEAGAPGVGGTGRALRAASASPSDVPVTAPPQDMGAPTTSADDYAEIAAILKQLAPSPASTDAPAAVPPAAPIPQAPPVARPRFDPSSFFALLRR